MGTCAAKAEAQKEGHGIEIDGVFMEMPEGAACEKVKDQKFVNEQPSYLREILEANGAQQIYEEFVKEIAAQPKGFWGGYKSTECFKVYQSFCPKFSEKGIELHCCRKAFYSDSSLSDEIRIWIVLVDKKKLPDFTPEYKWDGQGATD
mmetsp:Transcript_30062/g.54622  ORF Transcript_30062/g.54622 Transcript_30062/m.54622 type:complete len:148 (+) Transcript_30062:100-543(+)